MRSVEEFAADTLMAAPVAEIMNFVALCNDREIDYLKTSLLDQIAGKVIFVNALHHQHDSHFLFVIASRKEG